MAKKSVLESLAGIIPTVLVIVVLAVIFFYIRGVYAQTDEEKQKSKAFNKRGLFAWIGDFLVGEPKEGDRPEQDKDVDSEKNSADEAKKKEYEDAKQAYEDLQDKALVAHEDALIKYTGEQEAQKKLLQNLEQVLKNLPNEHYASSKDNKTKQKADTYPVINKTTTKHIVPKKGSAALEKRRLQNATPVKLPSTPIKQIVTVKKPAPKVYVSNAPHTNKALVTYKPK